MAVGLPLRYPVSSGKKCKNIPKDVKIINFNNFKESPNLKTNVHKWLMVERLAISLGAFTASVLHYE